MMPIDELQKATIFSRPIWELVECKQKIRILKALEKEISINLGLNTGDKNMAEHIVTGTTEEEREKEIYEYAIQCGWDEGWARSYAITLGKRWMPELEQNYIEFFHHQPLSDIKVGGISLNSLFAYWGRKDLTTAIRLLWLYKKDHYDDPDSVYTGGIPDVSLQSNGMALTVDIRYAS